MLKNISVKLQDREDIRAFILSCEKNLPVADWKANDLHIWPMIRLELFFHIRKKLFHAPKEIKKKVVANNTIVLSKRFRAYGKTINEASQYFNSISRLKEKEIVFFGQSVFRINFNNEFFNRFFDTIINENNLDNRCYVLESRLKEKEKISNKKLILDHDSIFEKYQSWQTVKRKIKKDIAIQFNLNRYDDFLDYLCANDITKDFASKFSERIIKETLIPKVFTKIDFYNRLLSKINPKKIVILCYYSSLELVAAANKRGIEVVEMQHGAISKAHMAYDSWSNIPVGGYDFLPKRYWCWNEYSKNLIDNWVNNNGNGSAFVGGNSWVNFWLTKQFNYPFSNFVLYTLQPDSLTLEQLFPLNVIDLIKSKETNWFIRLHPRQIEKRKEIEKYLSKNDVLELVNIENATIDPLPMLLRSCLVHVTNSSASTIEASFFEKKTILLHEIGNLYYPELINQGEAYYINSMRNDFANEFFKVVNSIEPNKQAQNTKVNNFQKDYFILN